MSTPAPINNGRCYWYKDGDGEVHIPGCWGAALGGPSECTCDVPLSPTEIDYKAQIDALERRLRHAELHLEWTRARLREADLREFPLVGEIEY